jgi:hypothetical protein
MQIVPLNPLLKYEDGSYWIMGITTKLMVHEHVIFDLDTRGAK